MSESRLERGVLDLSHRGLKDLPKDVDWDAIAKQVTSLIVKQNAIERFSRPSIVNLAKLSQLRTLDLANNQLSELPPKESCWNLLTALETLDVTNNQISSTKAKHLFSVIPATVKYLRLGYNPFRRLPKEISRLTELRELVLERCKLTDLAPEIGTLTTLSVLALQRNGLSTLPDEIGGLGKLIQLSLSGNVLTLLPSTIGALTSLTDLNVSNNQLTCIPAEIGQLSARLTWLDLSSNSLTSVPAQLFQLTRLELLDLSRNELCSTYSSAPWSQIGGLRSLTTLRLGCNHLTVAPVELAQLARLETLDLAHNKLAALTADLAALATCLRCLDISGQRCEGVFEPATVWKLTSLTTLRIGGHRIALANDVKALRRLRDIDLSGAVFTDTLPVESLSVLGRSLRRIDLTDATLAEGDTAINVIRTALPGVEIRYAPPRPCKKEDEAEQEEGNSEEEEENDDEGEGEGDSDDDGGEFRVKEDGESEDEEIFKDLEDERVVFEGEKGGAGRGKRKREHDEDEERSRQKKKQK